MATESRALGPLFRIIHLCLSAKRGCQGVPFDEDAALLQVVERYGEVFTDRLDALNHGLGIEAFGEATW